MGEPIVTPNDWICIGCYGCAGCTLCATSPALISLLSGTTSVSVVN